MYCTGIEHVADTILDNNVILYSYTYNICDAHFFLYNFFEIDNTKIINYRQSSIRNNKQILFSASLKRIRV